MITCDLTLHDLEKLRKLCSEQEKYFHRSFTQAQQAMIKDRAMIMFNKFSDAKKLRFKLTEIIDTELARVIDLAGSSNIEI